MRFTDEEKKAVERLIPYAKRKYFIADLLVNGYNSDLTKVDMRMVMRYSAGEGSGSTYKKDIYVFLELMARGVETHELFGEETIDKIIDWSSHSQGD